MLVFFRQHFWASVNSVRVASYHKSNAWWHIGLAVRNTSSWYSVLKPEGRGGGGAKEEDASSLGGSGQLYGIQACGGGGVKCLFFANYHLIKQSLQNWIMWRLHVMSMQGVNELCSSDRLQIVGSGKRCRRCILGVVYSILAFRGYSLTANLDTRPLQVKDWSPNS